MEGRKTCYTTAACYKKINLSVEASTAMNHSNNNCEWSQVSRKLSVIKKISSSNVHNLSTNMESNHKLSNLHFKQQFQPLVYSRIPQRQDTIQITIASLGIPHKPQQTSDQPHKQPMTNTEAIWIGQLITNRPVEVKRNLVIEKSTCVCFLFTFERPEHEETKQIQITPSGVDCLLA